MEPMVRRKSKSKSKSKRFNGYKRHIAADLDTELILACAITPANRPEEEATPDLQLDIARLPERSEIGSLHVDRGYIGSSLVKDVLARRGNVLCKPWVARNGNLFTKADFVINMRNRTIECPAGERSNTFSPAPSSSSIRTRAVDARSVRAARWLRRKQDEQSASPRTSRLSIDFAS